MTITVEQYQDSIPDCCQLRTAEEHAEQLLLCWGLVHDIKKGTVRKDKNCGLCEHNTLYTPAEYQAMLKKAMENIMSTETKYVK